jgi:hypothetical protein
VTELRVGFCSYEAAMFSVRAFHYSRTMPAGKMVRLGAWEGRRFVGVAAIFSRGNTPHIAKPFNLRQSQVCELTRVALGPHDTATSRIVAIALRLLKRQSPGLKAVISYADPMRGHDGRGVYAAGNWLYLGLTASECLINVRGELRHPRSVGSRFGTRSIPWLRQHVDPTAERIMQLPKHKFVYALDQETRARLAPLARPYPVRPKEQDSARSHAELGSATLTRPLSLADAEAARA